jgi:outer membrane receptor for ferrienterochelin and colicin
MNYQKKLCQRLLNKVSILIAFLLPLQLFAQDTAEFDKYFEMSLEEMMNVKVVTASAKSEIIPDAPANIFVITAPEMEKRGYRTLTDLLPDLPGTVVINREPSKTVLPIIRGNHGNNRLKVMINGMELNI